MPSKSNYRRFRNQSVEAQEGDGSDLEKLIESRKLTTLLIDSGKRENVHVSLHFGAGLADRLVSENKKLTWVGNGSSTIVINLKKYNIQAECPEVDVETFVTMDTSSLVVTMKLENYEEVMEKVIRAVFLEELSQEEFEKERDRIIDVYDHNLQQVEYAAKTEIQMHAMPNRLFSPQLVRDDLRQMEFSDVIHLNQTLFQQNNVKLVVCGDLSHAGIKEWFEKNDHLLEDAPAHDVDRVNRQPHEFMDRHLVYQQAKDSYEIGTILFRKKKSGQSMAEEELFLRVIGEVVFQDHFFVQVAPDQSSIIYVGNQYVNYKNRIRTTVWNQKKFDEAKEKIRDQFNQIIEYDPKKFSVIFGQYAIKQIHLPDLLYETQADNFPQFIDYIRNVKEKMVETKLSYLKGEKP